jgi:hypothetical protein
LRAHGSMQVRKCAPRLICTSRGGDEASTRFRRKWTAAIRGRNERSGAVCARRPRTRPAPRLGRDDAARSAGDRLLDAQAVPNPLAAVGIHFADARLELAIAAAGGVLGFAARFGVARRGARRVGSRASRRRIRRRRLVGGRAVLGHASRFATRLCQRDAALVPVEHAAAGIDRTHAPAHARLFAAGSSVRLAALGTLGEAGRRCAVHRAGRGLGSRARLPSCAARGLGCRRRSGRLGGRIDVRKTPRRRDRRKQRGRKPRANAVPDQEKSTAKQSWMVTRPSTSCHGSSPESGAPSRRAISRTQA